MEHNPQTVLAIGEIALFLIGIILSVVLLAILLLPSLMKFTVPHWVRIHYNTDRSLFDLILPKLFKHGYQIVTQEEQFLEVTKDGATRFHIYLEDDGQSLAMFRQGDETKRSDPTSILAGAGIAWVVILCHEALEAHSLKPQWAWDEEFNQLGEKPFGSVMYQVILLNPWR